MRIKTLFFSLAFIFITSLVLSQSIGREVISASGGQQKSWDVQLSWTIGQSGLAGTLVSNSIILSQGFEQENDVQIVPVFNIHSHAFIADLVPNPVLGDAYLKISSDRSSNFAWTLFDSKGVLMHSGEQRFPVSGSNIEPVPTSMLNSGMYYLLIKMDYEDKTPAIQTIILIKL